METGILSDIVIIFALSISVNLLFNRLKVPNIIGYMLTGIIAGPHLLGLIKGKHEIELMAEIGVVLLMFTLGLEFSLKQLIKIRKVVFLGGFLQFVLTGLVIFGVAKVFDLPPRTAIFAGFITSLSSTAIVLKILQERSELTSNYGRTVIGILIFQDLMLVPLLLFTQFMSGDNLEIGQDLLLLSLKGIGIIAFIYAGSNWATPWLLKFLVTRKNQELFLMSVFLFCMAVALLTFSLGMSLAFGAFLAGLMISASDYSHNVFGNLVPFKNMFASFFFVSIGMLLDLGYVFDNLTLVSFTLVLVLLVKTIIAGGTGFILGHTFRGTVLVGLALSQVGEFSFLLAKIGRSQQLLPENLFQLFLSVAVLSMSLTPFFISVARPFTNFLLKLPLPRVLIDGLFPLKEIPVPEYTGHLVIIGKDLRAQKLSMLAKKQDIPYVSICFDPIMVREKQIAGEAVIYGDALNEPILLKAHVERADIVVVSVGDVIASTAIIDKVRQINHHAFILGRAKNVEDLELLFKQGANHIVPEKFETAIEFFNQILKKRLMPQRDISVLVNRVREDYYGVFREYSHTEPGWFLEELPDFEINAYRVETGSEIVGRSLRDIALRRRMNVTLLAIKRENEIIEHPDADISFVPDDCIYLLGRPENLVQAQKMLTSNQTIHEEPLTN